MGSKSLFPNLEPSKNFCWDIAVWLRRESMNSKRNVYKRDIGKRIGL